MSKARLVITAVEVEGRNPAELCSAYGVSRSWLYELLAWYRAEGDAAFQPRSRRPRSSPRATAPATVELVLQVRKQLSEAGLDAGADTIGWHLTHQHRISLSRATIHRILTRHGAVTPTPARRPKASYLRFAAEQPNETWQSDFAHYRLATGADVEIITWLDDHSRLALHVSAHARITGPIVLATFRQACELHGYPASTLTDNGMVYTTRLAGGRGGRTGFEAELHRLGIAQKNSRPNHPTTCGKAERFQQTLKKWLAAQPTQPTTIPQLQALLDVFVAAYNHDRPHRSLPHRATPAAAYAARPKTGPAADRDTHHRVRTDKIDKAGCVTLRLAGRLHHIGIGRTHTGTGVLLVVQDLHVRVIDAATGELSASSPSTPPATTSPPANHPDQPANQRRPNPQNVGSGVRDVLRHHRTVADQFEPATDGWG